MLFLQSLVIRFLVQSVLMGVRVPYETAKRIADAFSLITAIVTFDPHGHIAGVVLQEMLEDAVFTSGATVLATVRTAALQNWSLAVA